MEARMEIIIGILVFLFILGLFSSGKEEKYLSQMLSGNQNMTMLTHRNLL